MTDNRNTQEAAEVREKSEFIKRIEDFANYMQKEYINDCDDRSLLMAYIDLSLWREIRPLRRQIARLKAAEREEQEERKKRRMAALLFEAIHHLIQRDDDDEEE